MRKGHRVVRTIGASLGLGLLVALHASPAVGAEPPATLYVECEMFATRVPVPIERIDPYVPDQGYKIQQAGGMATVQPVAAYCSFPDEGADAEMDYSTLGVPLSSPAGVYDPWEVSDSSLWHSINAPFGKYSPMVPGVTYDVERVAGQPLTAHQDVPWSQGAYSMSAVVSPGVPAPPEFHLASHHWARGPRGDVHRTDDNFGLVAHGAVVTIDADPGSDLARILGTSDPLTLPGAYLQFKAVDTWEMTEL